MRRRAMQEPPRRSNCPVAIALDVIGDKWSLLVLRDILLNHRQRFGELQAAGEDIASNILSNRLRSLTRNGILDRASDPDDRRQFIYTATQKGLDLLPLVLELGAWGARYGGRTAAPQDAADAYYADRAGKIRSATEAAVASGATS
ncbi:MAG: helix-turn-helix transcriptional regulator [Nannocystaceae bacterium]|nr:helix-turn-helix transcriptional regulator [Nannocystaceae bacterium]